MALTLAMAPVQVLALVMEASQVCRTVQGKNRPGQHTMQRRDRNCTTRMLNNHQWACRPMGWQGKDWTKGMGSVKELAKVEG